MCGIAGFVALPDHGISGCAPAVLASLQHRGPDDRGWLRSTGRNVERGRMWIQPEKEPEVLLLHTRLSIIDTSNSGWQPMSTADERYHLIFNGEIYNFIEIRKELERLGYRFRSSSDTEVLLNALAEWGIEALKRLVGMFAFALLDTPAQPVSMRRYWAREPGLESSISRFALAPAQARQLEPHVLTCLGCARSAGKHRFY